MKTTTKMLLAAAGAALAMAVAGAQEIPYTVAATSWLEQLGNHRARLYVATAAPAVWAEIPWRRHDEDPSRIAVLVFDSDGRQVLNSVAGNIRPESCDLVFEARRAGDYFVYYFPHADTGGRRPRLGEKGQYRAPEQTAAPAWLQGSGLSSGAIERTRLARLPVAEVKEFQARTEFDSFFPMEVAANPEELRQLRDRFPQPYLLFPEDREYPIRVRDNLPLRWIRSGPGQQVRGAAYRGETFVFQVGVYAQKDLAPADAPITASFAALSGPYGAGIPASAFECFNTGGIDTRGEPFQKEFKVAAGKVAALWCAVKVPLDLRPGRYRGNATVRVGDAALPLAIDLNVKIDVIRHGGEDQPFRMARLSWLNSRIGLEDTITSPYTPLRVEGRRVECLGREVTFSDQGFPSSVKAGGRELLSDPVTLHVESGGQAVQWRGMTKLASATPAKVVMDSDSTGQGFRLRVRTTMEFDGGIDFAVQLTAEHDAKVSDIALEIPYLKDAVPYAAGMSLAGGKRPASWQWKWSDQPARWKEQGSNLEYFLWMGGPHAGLYTRLKSPLEDWKNEDRGGVRMEERAGGVAVSMSGGPRSVAAGQKLSYSFRMLPTPLKPLDAGHWGTRYLHAYRPPAEAKLAGATVINIHHNTLPNLYINYPFLNLDLLIPYVREAHAEGLKVKAYYTVRELTTHLPELWAFRSLGEEIYRPAGTQGHGNPNLDFWLQEHLTTGYTPAWITRTPAGDIDAAIRVFFDSRLNNFYLEGLKWLLDNAEIDGIYLDEIGYPREMMQRVRRVLEQRPGATIDLHGNRDWWSCNSPIGYYMEHLPYVDRLWFGEAFNPDSPPEFWLVEMSGIPFGLSGDMLQNPNPWRGMLFGMTARIYGGSGGQSPSGIWKLWDEFGIQQARMVGWWEKDCPVRTGRDDVLATVYRREGKALIALASWAKAPATVPLQVDWRALGIDPARARIVAPAIANLQDARTFLAGEPLVLAPGKGWLLEVDQQ